MTALALGKYKETVRSDRAGNLDLSFSVPRVNENLT
jgi:hypothetical protein